MAEPPSTSGTEELTTEHLVGGADRRFYAFVLDRLLAWGLYAAARRTPRTPPDRAGPALGRRRRHRRHGAAGLAAHRAARRALRGSRRARRCVGLRVLSAEDARPIGVGRARCCAPSSSAWPRCRPSASARPRWPGPRWWTRPAGAAAGTTCGAGSVVVDVRPVPVVEEPEDEAPRQVVNLTAMRLVPASPTPPRRIPTRGQAAARTAARAEPRPAGPADGHAAAGARLAAGRATPPPTPPSAAVRGPCSAAAPALRPRRSRARPPRRAGPLAGRLRHRRAVRGARADPGRPAPRAAARRAGEAAGRRCPPTT